MRVSGSLLFLVDSAHSFLTISGAGFDKKLMSHCNHERDGGSDHVPFV
jgi:hypothetical protein